MQLIHHQCFWWRLITGCLPKNIWRPVCDTWNKTFQLHTKSQTSPYIPRDRGPNTHLVMMKPPYGIHIKLSWRGSFKIRGSKFPCIFLPTKKIHPKSSCHESFWRFFRGIGAWALGDEVATAELKLFDGIIQHPEAKAANPLTHRRRFSSKVFHVGGWTYPSEKILVKIGPFPQVRLKMKKYLKRHQSHQSVFFSLKKRGSLSRWKLLGILKIMKIIQWVTLSGLPLVELSASPPKWPSKLERICFYTSVGVKL